jgi:hypothetical protein
MPAGAGMTGDRKARNVSVYTVHEPLAHPANPLSEAERIVFVRDGFSFWAFIASPLWMLWHRMWLVFVGYVLVTLILIAGLAALAASRATLVIVGLIIALVVGLESGTLRRLTLHRRGWRNVGIVSGADVEDAERRFFGTWSHKTPSANPADRAPPPLPAAPSPRGAPPSDVIGLFPEPGARR